MRHPYPVSHLRRLACALFAALHLVPAAMAEVPQIKSQFDFSSDTAPAARKFYFETIPGRRYTLQRSTDLQTWSTVTGYPQTATGLAIGHTFVQAANEFFRIEPIDDQAPEIVDQFPGEDAFAIRRFDDLRFLLSDATGIDSASIRLTLGNGTALSVGAPGLTFVDNVLTYDSGDAALGAYGATVPVTLTMADTLGHSVTHTFSFTLEVLPKVVSNLYVFGSPAAQRAGQEIPATPTAALAKQAGPVAMAAGDPWSIESVMADRVIIAYTGATAPVFVVDTYLANLTPVKLTDIFYRKILSVSDAPATRKLTLMTTDVPLAEIVEEGTATLSADSAVYDLDAGLSLLGVDPSYLPAFDPVRLYTRGWEWSYPPPQVLAFSVPAAPQAVSVVLGGSLSLTGQAQGGSGAIFYQWLHNGNIIPGQTSSQITIPNVTVGNAGTYTLRARTGTETVTSPAFAVSTYNAGTPLSGFAYIPAGSFEMGQTDIATPVHSVYVSAFYMGRTEVTWLDWRTVRDWARASGLGYTDLWDGAGKADNHPVHAISWYQMVKWCNAKSEMAGLTPCYTLNGTVYRTTDNSAVVCNWGANGYRLPTEAEWEKAARGGLSDKLFPWGDTISHSQANYRAVPGTFTYDVSLTSGYHPTYGTGSTPYTSPVGSFAPNGYGLYDMAGNLLEWCWDWYGSYTAGSQSDPRGPASGSYRVGRGGDWFSYAYYCRVAGRNYGGIPGYYFSIGFRLARSSVP